MSASALIVTPGAADANSYCSLARARTTYANTPGATDLTVSLILTSSAAAATVVTTAAAHNLATGDTVVIAGHTSTPTLNGTHAVTVTGDATFALPVTVTVAGTGGTATHDDALTQALLAATALVDDKMEFDGCATTWTQALAWPRAGLRTKVGGALPSTTIPSALEDATALLARELLVQALAGANTDLVGVTRIKAGRAFEIEFAAHTPAPHPIPDTVARLIARWGTRIGASAAVALVRG